MGKNIGKDWNENLSGKYSQELLDHAKQSATDALKTAVKKLVIWLIIKLLIKLRKSKKLHNKIIQKQL